MEAEWARGRRRLDAQHDSATRLAGDALEAIEFGNSIALHRNSSEIKQSTSDKFITQQNA
jgi:hypothetical protein